MTRRTAEALARSMEPFLRELGKDAKVPGYKALRQRFGGSNHTIAKAINLLVGWGLVTHKVRVGMVVTDVPLLPQAPNLHAILEFRTFIEPPAAAVAARVVRRIPNSRLAKAFRDAYAALESANDREFVREEVDADRQFHASVHALADNSLLQDALARTRFLMMTNVHDVVTTLHESQTYRDNTREQHHAIYERINDGDPKGARSAMETHLVYAHREIEALA